MSHVYGFRPQFLSSNYFSDRIVRVANGKENQLSSTKQCASNGRVVVRIPDVCDLKSENKLPFSPLRPFVHI